MRKVLSAVVIIITAALAAVIFPGTVGRGAASLTALSGEAHFMDAQSSNMFNVYPGTSCHIYAPGQMVTVDDLVIKFGDQWREDFARGFNRQLLERWPHLVKTECGKPNPHFQEEVDFRETVDNMVDNLEAVDNSID